MTSTTIVTEALTLEAAHTLLAEARRACIVRGFPATIAITDAGGHLRAFERADNAPFLTVEVAIDKAWTAASFGTSTQLWNQYVADPAVAPLAQHPRLMAVAGGVPIFHGTHLVGGIGISGGTAVQDHEAAEEALRHVGLMGSAQ